MTELSRDPADLVNQTYGAHSQYPYSKIAFSFHHSVWNSYPSLVSN